MHVVFVSLLINLDVPNDSSMSSESEPQTDQIKSVAERWSLAEVAAAAVPTVLAGVVVFAVHAVELVGSVNLVKQGWAKSSDNRKEQHCGCYTRGPRIETLSLSFDGTKAHGNSRQEQYTGENTAHDTAFDELTLALAKSNTVKEHLHDSREKGIDGSAHTHR
ncbi:hypothetical protein HG531_012578 [Fusarium graminearum]|nr:hypothetical protein HG531_012578 [Fusarium graminearum]